MTIYLPEEFSLFRRAFNETCDRILSCKQDSAFYSLFTELARCLREHSLQKEVITELETASDKRKQIFNDIAVEALEDTWKRLWEHHRPGLKQRKHLVSIKRSITSPTEISYSPLYYRLLFSISEFCYSSSEPIPTALFSPKFQEIEQKFLIPGQNNDEKRMNMRMSAETSPLFCWERIRFLEQCHIGSGSPLPPPKHSMGSWDKIRNKAWQSATERCDAEALLGARMSLAQKLSSNPDTSIDKFLICEYQIHRQDYERYLCSLKNHISIQLFKIENSQHAAANDPHLTLPGSQKENFVIDHVSKYWKKHPLAKRDEVFQNYCCQCPASKMLSRDRWDQIVRDRKLDPRPKEAKKRGPGKKTLQN